MIAGLLIIIVILLTGIMLLLSALLLRVLPNKEASAIILSAKLFSEIQQANAIDETDQNFIHKFRQSLLNKLN